MRAEIVTSTGTGSLANKVGAEAFIYKSKVWTLIYVKEHPVFSAQVGEGRLKLSGTPVKNSATKKYYVRIGGCTLVTDSCSFDLRASINSVETK